MIQALIFYSFAALMLLAAIMVITLRHPVRSVLALIVVFFAASVLWMLLEAEFLSLVLIFVYVGAVMTLFLFVVMMINIDMAAIKEGFVRYLPWGILVMVFLMGLVIMALSSAHGILTALTPVNHPVNYSNTKILGEALYTKYAFPFELTALLLLVAIIAAISLAYRGKRERKSQNIKQQIIVRREDRIKIVRLEEKK